MLTSSLTKKACYTLHKQCFNFNRTIIARILERELESYKVIRAAQAILASRNTTTV